jgi:hypothetical protein
MCVGKEVEETLKVVDAQTKEAAAKKEVVEGEEAIASEKAAAAKAIKASTRPDHLVHSTVACQNSCLPLRCCFPHAVPSVYSRFHFAAAAL